MSYTKKISLIDTAANRDVIINYIMDIAKEKHPEVEPSFFDTFKNELESFDLGELLEYNLYDAEDTLKEIIVIAILAVYRKNNDFDEYMNSSNSFVIMIKDFFDNLSLSEVSAMQKGYSTEYNEKLEKEVVDFVGTPIFEKKKFFINADFIINTKHHYSYHALITRFMNRVGYRWEEANLAHFKMESRDNGGYNVHIDIEIEGVSPYTAEVAMQKLKFRFGPTSGRPWYACQLENMAISNV